VKVAETLPLTCPVNPRNPGHTSISYLPVCSWEFMIQISTYYSCGNVLLTPQGTDNKIVGKLTLPDDVQRLIVDPVKHEIFATYELLGKNNTASDFPFTWVKHSHG
jgi:hypothetical protein